MTKTRERQTLTRSRYPPTRRTTTNQKSKEAEDLRGPSLTWMAEEAPHDAEEAEEARMLRAEEQLPEPHEACEAAEGLTYSC